MSTTVKSGLPGQSFRSGVLEKKWNNGFNATTIYRDRLRNIVKPGMNLLHAGCGWDKHNISSVYSDTCKVTGIDLDPVVADRFHSEFHLASLNDMPFEENSFDIVFSEYVFEHLSEPHGAFDEIRRVLKPGGRLLIVTPNLFSYKSIVARFTPYSFHLAMGRIRYGRGHEADMYPTHFLCNTDRSFRRFAAQHEFDVVAILLVTNGPTWFEKIPIVFEIFHIFHLLIDRINLFSSLRCAMVVELRKPNE